MADVTACEVKRSHSCYPGRKLPPIPNETLSSSKNSQNLKRIKTQQSCTQILFKECSLCQEYLLLKKAQIPGMYVIPSAKSSYVWNGVMCLKHGYYKGAIFRFKLVIPETVLDDECPSVLFTPPIYHPMINKQTGVMNINWSFYPWIKNIHKIWQVIAHVKKVFIQITTIDSENAEAANEYEKDRQLFKEKARLAVENCSVKLSATIIDDDEDDDDNNNNNNHNNHNKNNDYDNTDDVNCNLKTHSDDCDADNYDEHSFIFSELSNEELAEAKGMLLAWFADDKEQTQ